MKIALLGATGGTGGEVLTQALAAGHTVTALVRTPAKVLLQNPHLTVLQGDATAAADLARAFAGADAVLSTIGSGGFFEQRHPTTFYSDTTRAILDAMATAGVSRLLLVTSSGVEEDPAARGAWGSSCAAAWVFWGGFIDCGRCGQLCVAWWVRPHVQYDRWRLGELVQTDARDPAALRSRVANWAPSSS